MSKTEQPIKFIYATRFDSDNLTFTTRRLNVVKECSRYVSLEDGSRNTTGILFSIPAFSVSNPSPFIRI